jgi:hypothetical protein
MCTVGRGSLFWGSVVRPPEIRLIYCALASLRFQACAATSIRRRSPRISALCFRRSALASVARPIGADTHLGPPPLPACRRHTGLPRLAGGGPSSQAGLFDELAPSQEVGVAAAHGSASGPRAAPPERQGRRRLLGPVWTHAVGRCNRAHDLEESVPFKLFYLPLCDPPAIVDARLPGLAPGQVAKCAAAAPQAHYEVVDKVFGWEIRGVGHRRLLARQSPPNKPRGLGSAVTRASQCALTFKLPERSSMAERDAQATARRSLDCLAAVAHRYSAQRESSGISHPLQTERKTRCETVDMRTNQLHMLTRHRMDF